MMRRNYEGQDDVIVADEAMGAEMGLSERRQCI